VTRAPQPAARRLLALFGSDRGDGTGSDQASINAPSALSRPGWGEPILRKRRIPAAREDTVALHMTAITPGSFVHGNI
jgi:hypothetical protein